MTPLSPPGPWVDAGLNPFDTADGYSCWVPGHSGGESETTLGKWLKQSGKRNQVLIAAQRDDRRRFAEAG